MPKAQGKKTGGNKNRRNARGNGVDEKRELLVKEEGQCYARVTKLLGNCRVSTECFDGTVRLAMIRGKMQNKVWITVGDLILLGLRDFQDDKADVIHKYSASDARQLKALGELPDSTSIAADTAESVGDDSQPFDFADI